MTTTMVIFGASGDLTRRKLVPALYELHRKKRLPEDTRIVGVSRSPFTDDAWREHLAESARQFVGKSFQTETWQQFARNVYYNVGDATDTDSFARLASRLSELEGGHSSTRVYYLSMMPALYAPTVTQLGAHGLASDLEGPRRVVIEKPFGVNLATAKQLNADVHAVFREDQVYRIDHYLGKETVQNLLVFRFANGIFEPVWNRNHVDHVQITVAEEVAVGSRAGYYDKSGVLRDMFQNHILQLLMVTAMEAPARYEPDLIRNEKVKVLQSIRGLTPDDIRRDTLRAQYEDYLKEPGVPSGSQTATFAALRLHVDNWRWQGVPFYLRSGKLMSCRTTQIVIQYRQPPHNLFRSSNQQDVDANRLVIQIQPAEGIQLHILSKTPDAGMRLRMTDLDFRFRQQFPEEIPDAYQRLLLDAMQGDASLFARGDEVELAWRIMDPILDAWERGEAGPLHTYPAGQWGPDASLEWIRSQHREWFDVCPVLR
ncbi:MAG TPA: glucose-6-phosphate dehydrogenase [Pirellulaceae bacterium]